MGGPSTMIVGITIHLLPIYRKASETALITEVIKIGVVFPSAAGQ